MTLATRGNVRTAAAAKTGSMPKALDRCLPHRWRRRHVHRRARPARCHDDHRCSSRTPRSVILIGFGFGGSLLALFLRVGGGIFTKAADVGADLVGKVEAGIPEDDPRNPATIADNVGDNVGDCAGMAADLFESYEVTLVASIILGVAAFNSIGANPALGLMFPLAARAIGVIASIVGVFAVKAKEGETNALKPINRGFLVAGTLTLIGTLIVALVYVGNDKANAGWKCFGAVAVGLVLAQLISRLTEYYTGTHFGPVQEIAESAETGPATVVLSGTASGLESLGVRRSSPSPSPSVWPWRSAAATCTFSLYLVALCGMGMLATTGVIVSEDTFGPVSDNAAGIAEMSGEFHGERAADHGQPRRRRQHHQGSHQGLRHRLGRDRRRRPVRQLHRDGRQRARHRRQEPERRRVQRAAAADQRRRAEDLHRPADRWRRAVPVLVVGHPRRRPHRRRRRAGSAQASSPTARSCRARSSPTTARSSTSAPRPRCAS